MTASTWDPQQYLRYADDRERPFWDLVDRIAVPAARDVVDLGCGPGTATRRLTERWPEATVVGLDNSPSMIEVASSQPGHPRVRFELADLASWAPEPASVDVIISNAALQWVPGHGDLFARWLAALRPGGALAFQVPGNFDAPSHTALRDVASSARWRDRLSAVPARLAVVTPTDYEDRLRELGATIDLWETTYYHVLSGPDPVLEWVRGSALRPYLAELGHAEAGDFTKSYAETLRRAYPRRADGTTLFPFRRIFAVVTPTS